MNKRRYTTSRDESLGHGGGQQSLCQVTSLLVSFATNGLVIICVFCFLTWPERRKQNKTMQVMRKTTKHNTMSTKLACPSHAEHYTRVRIWIRHELKDRDEIWFVLAWVSIKLQVARLSSNQILLKCFHYEIYYFDLATKIPIKRWRNRLSHFQLFKQNYEVTLMKCLDENLRETFTRLN